MPNCDKPVLFETLVITAVASLLLLWQAVNVSPAGVLLLGLLALSYFNYLVGKRDVLYPAFTFTAIWTAVTIAYLTCPIDIRPLGWKTTAILLGGTAFFSVGSLIGNRPIHLKRSQDRKNGMGTDRDNPQARFVLLAYTLFAVPWVVLEARNLAGGSLSLSPEFLINLRLKIVSLALQGDAAYSSKFLSSAFILGGFTFLIFILEERRKWARLLCACYMILFFLLTTGRAVLMQALCWWLCVALLRKRNRTFHTTVKSSAWAFIGVIVLMMSLTFLTKARTQDEGASQEAAGIALTYVAGPVAAFDYAVYHPAEFEEQQSQVFEGVRTRLSALNIIHSTPAKPFDDFVFVPFGINVYTGFKPYYEDFGVFGCLLVFCVIGLIEGQLFWSAINGHRVARLFFVYASYPLMFSTFDDLYTTHNGDVLCLYISIFAFVYFYIMKPSKLRLFRNQGPMPPSPFIVK